MEIYQKQGVYSWSTKVDFTINSQGGFKDIENANVSLLWGQDYILTLKPVQIHPNQEQAGWAGYQLRVDATDTAADAENIGLKLAYALLSIAVEKNWGMSLSWPDSPLPCRVIDRTASLGATCQGFGSVTSHVETSEVIDMLESGFTEHEEVPYSLLLSMELCASSRFENNGRSKLIMLMSALEALANQLDLSSELDSVLTNLQLTVKEAEIEDDSLKNSLLGQISGLRRESVRRAIRRLLTNLEFSEEDCKFVDEAYQARSKIVHEGIRIPELAAMNARLDAILRNVYAVI